MISASSSTDTRTCLREAPSVRSVASSRVRWATVIDIVLKMTNAPTKSAIPPKASRKYSMNFVNSATSSLSSLACAMPDLTATSAAIASSIRFTS
jgi:hypothetical protein